DDCDIAAQKRGMLGCAFAGHPSPENDADRLAMIQTRAENKDPAAINILGQKYFFGELGLQKDMRRVVDLYTEAAELGSAKALFNLGFAYQNGDGVQQDKAMAVEFYEKVAMKGHATSRCNLGCYEGRKGNHDRTARHFLISGKLNWGMCNRLSLSRICS
ncbi:hypothetical protein THAOC_18449, partial [Thalassiosira oceanica]